MNWNRQDNNSGIEISKEGWDSLMQTYPSVIQVKTDKFLFYNGNGFGKTGIGFAKWE